MKGDVSELFGDTFASFGAPKEDGYDENDDKKIEAGIDLIQNREEQMKKDMQVTSFEVQVDDDNRDNMLDDYRMQSSSSNKIEKSAFI